MENREFLEQIQQYAVRIGNAGDKELYGSGTLFLVSKRKKVCVLTAAHVVYSLMGKIKKKELKICLTCKDKKDDIHCIIVDDTKCICIYSEYNKNKRKKEFFNDLALIDIPWESWMDDMTGFRLASGNSGVEIKGYGFPLSLDEEKDRSNFYFCLFVNESIGSDNKSRIQGNSFCAKKYIFEEKLMNEKEYLERVDARIFSLEIEKTVGETFKINRIELQNFRRYEGNLKIDLTGKNKKPSAFTLIYAPNGYGKTSLFDGLEYAFKGEVERIVDLIKSNKDQPLKGAIYHNKNCADKPAYSQIELEDGRIIKRNVASIKDGKNDSRLNQLGKNSGLRHMLRLKASKKKVL